MKKLNITKEQFNRSNYFQKKYGKLEYVSESGRLFKTNKGKVLKFNEGFISNMGKDGQRLYSIIYMADGWDGSVQEYGKSEEDAIQTAIAKGKLDGDEDIVKVVDLGEKGEYLESSRKLAKEAGRKVIPAANGCSIHDMGDCWIVTNKNGLNIGQCRTLIDAEDIAENADEYTTKKLGYAESRKLVKEGAGAGYTVTIKDLKFGKILDAKEIKDKKGNYDYHECRVEIIPGTYEIEAEDYYNDFFWQEHEFGEKATAKIDGGVATISYGCMGFDGVEPEIELSRELENGERDIAFDYGWGWVHAGLPDKIESDHVDVESSEFYGSIDKIELNAPDLADAVNSGYASIFDRDEEEEEEEEEIEDDDGEPVNEEYDRNRDEGRKNVMDALEEFRQVLWDDTKVDDKDEHDLRRSLFQDVDDKISQAIQKYFKYSRM